MSKCYNCKHRRNIPGDAHSSCAHPSTGSDDMFDGLVSIVSGKALKAAEELNIQADPAGVRNGWFVWPANFDPAWLKNCDGFEDKGE